MLYETCAKLQCSKDIKRVTEPKWALALVPQIGACSSPLEKDFSTSPHFLCKLYLLPSRSNPNLTSDSQNIGQEKSRDQQLFFSSSVLMRKKQILGDPNWKVFTGKSIKLNLLVYTWEVLGVVNTVKGRGNGG